MALGNYICKTIAASSAFLSLLCILATAQSATTLDVLIKDFKPIDGYVVMHKDGEYIIDLDASKGVSVGDLFSVLGSAEPIVHPISKKVIGHLDTVKEVLKVTRLKTGFSFARSLNKSANLDPGTPIRRYEGLKAYYRDRTGKGTSILGNLRERLPNLIWTDQDLVQSSSGNQRQVQMPEMAVLQFIVTAGTLRVLDAEQNQLHEYTLNIGPDGHIKAGNKDSAQPGLLATGPPSQSASKQPPVRKPSKAQNSDGRMPIDFLVSRPIGELKSSAVMADFIQIGSQILMASTDGMSLQIFKVSENLQMLTKAKIPASTQVLALKWWYPDIRQPPFLAVVVWAETQPSSTIFTLINDTLTPIVKRPRSILGSFDLDGDDRPETLLSQQFDPDSFYGHRVSRIALNEKKVQSKRLGLDIPLNFTVIGSRFADLTGDGKLESVFVRNGVLNIYSGKKQLYSSPKQMGGTLSVLTYQKDSSFKDYISTSAAFEIAPVAVDLDNDGRLELLTVSSNQPGFSAPGLKSSITNIRFASIKFLNNQFIKQFIGRTMDRPVQGLSVLKNRMLYIASEPKSMPIGSGTSYLNELQLN